jgi:hypothetical protein
MNVKIRNLDTDWSAWVPAEAIERSVLCNGPDGCFALMPEDWPEEDIDRDEVLSRLDAEPELNMWYLAQESR